MANNAIKTNNLSETNNTNYVSLSNLSMDKKTEIIKKGFCLNNENKISLKKYYEETIKYSLFQLKGYQYQVYEALDQ